MTQVSRSKPRVGVGIIIENSTKQILIGKRIGSHAPYYSILGGSLEMGETFEQTAIREAQEELGITIHTPKVIAVTNNLETYKSEGHHSISIILLVKKFDGEPRIMEPHKCSELFWCDPRNLPIPHFDASRLGVACYLENVVYKSMDNHT